MSRKKIYNTPEEKKAALNENAKKWYKKHKNDPEYIMRRKWYQTKYYDGLDVDKEAFLREYNADYALYVRSVRTGRLARKIANNKERIKHVEACIARDEKRLQEVTARFKHLEENQKYERH